MTQLAPAPEQTTTPRKERDPYFDNAKYLAILLVASGHVIAGMGLSGKTPVAEATYYFIYMFHMPLFIVITGYFSRNFTFSSGKSRKLITNLGVPYVVFELSYSIMDWRMSDHELRISLLDPIYLTWFMLALFLWRLSTPVWQQIRWPFAVAVIIGLLSYTGPMSGQLDMHRVFGLAPFYVLGLCLRKEHFEQLRRPWVPYAGALTLLLGFLMMFYVKDHLKYSWLYWRDSNYSLGAGELEGTLIRLVIMTAATVLVAAFLAIVPHRRTWFTRLGATTIYAYLLHGFLVKYVQYRDWDQASWLQNIPGMLLLMACAMIVATLLCTPPVVRAMHWAVEPRMTWAFRDLRNPPQSEAQIAQR